MWFLESLLNRRINPSNFKRTFQKYTKGFELDHTQKLCLRHPKNTMFLSFGLHQTSFHWNFYGFSSNSNLLHFNHKKAILTVHSLNQTFKLIKRRCIIYQTMKKEWTLLPPHTHKHSLTNTEPSKMNWFRILSEESFPKQRDDINAELANTLSNSSESSILRKFDRFQLHQPYPVLMQRDRLPLSRIIPIISPHESHFVKSQSLSPLESQAQQTPQANYFVNDAMFLARSRSTSLTLKPITTVHHVPQTGEDSSQSSLNLSASSGYLSGSSSANSSNLNLSGRSSSSSM